MGEQIGPKRWIEDKRDARFRYQSDRLFTDDKGNTSISVNILYVLEIMSIHRSRRSTTVTVIEAVADREDVDIRDLPPLGNAVDIEALDELLSHWASRPSNQERYVEFQYAGYTVSLQVADRLRVEIE